MSQFPIFEEGQTLTSTDLNQLRNFLEDRDRLHNQLLHGSGVVCGLEVVPTDPPTASVEVRPGAAIDCCGRSITLVETRQFAVQPPAGDYDHLYLTIEHDITHESPDCCEEDCSGHGVRGVVTPLIDASTNRPAETAFARSEHTTHRCPHCVDSRVLLAVVDLTKPDHVTEANIDMEVRRLVPLPGSGIVGVAHLASPVVMAVVAAVAAILGCWLGRRTKP